MCRDGRSKRNYSVKTTMKAIAEYWAEYSEEHDISADFYWGGSLKIALKVCWRCGHKTRRLEKCHIVPHALGGKDEPANLLLMCGRCHREAPNCTDPNFILMWLDTERQFSPNWYWPWRGLQEFERLFGRPCFSNLDAEAFKEFEKFRFNNPAFKDKSDEKVLQAQLDNEYFPTPPHEADLLMTKAFRKVVKHFGENGLNPSTLAYIWWDVEKGMERLERRRKKGSNQPQALTDEDGTVSPNPPPPPLP